MAKSRKVS